MKICRYCHSQNNDNSAFCISCGEKLVSNEPAPGNYQNFNSNPQQPQYPNTNQQTQPQYAYANSNDYDYIYIFQRKIHKKLAIGIGIGVAILAVILAMYLPKRQYYSFVSAFNNGKYEKAKKIEREMTSDSLKDLVDSFIESRIISDYNSYIHKQLDYDTFISRYEHALDYTNASYKYSEVTTIKKTHETFQKAKELEESGDLFAAANEYLKVKEAYHDYSAAQSKLDFLKPIVKQQLVKDLDACLAEGDFSGGLSKITKARDLFPDDTVLNNYKSKLEEKKKEADLVKLKENQEASVVSAKLTVQHNTNKSKYPDMLIAVIKNNSNKTISSYEVAYLAFDKNCDPVKLTYNTEPDVSPVHLLKGTEPECSIKPGKQSSANRGLFICSNNSIHSVIACVIEVEYSDGTSWYNNYYDTWKKQYENKRLE